MNDLKVSVIITCYNLEQCINRAINSCLNQTMPDDRYEIIVVDDASIDQSWNVIESFGTLICPLRLDVNQGVSGASNAGIRMSKGKYTVRVDGDDYINKNFLHVMSEILEWNDDVGFVYCDQIIVTETGERKKRINTLERLLDNGAGVMFRKRYLDVLGLYDEKLQNCEDYDLIRRYIKNFDGYNLKVPYYRYIQRANSLSCQQEIRTQIKKEIDGRNC